MELARGDAVFDIFGFECSMFVTANHCRVHQKKRKDEIPMNMLAVINFNTPEDCLAAAAKLKGRGAQVHFIGDGTQYTGMPGMDYPNYKQLCIVATIATEDMVFMMGEGGATGVSPIYTK